ncbi:ATP-binding cassette domain-containing protein [Candidatus Saccharibacteria bacterium]|nr:ATP-binding cassette domain-containing protein [Candidatus Saccharibacteria bacterium]
MKQAIIVSKLSKSFRVKQNDSVLTGLFKPNYKNLTAVDNINFIIQPGESVAFLGPNGAGKTTTTKMLTGLIKPSSGHISTLGYDPFTKNFAFLKKIGLVMGNKAGLNWDLSAKQSYQLMQKIYEIPISKFNDRVGELTKLLNVEHVLEKQVRKLSLGERMKLEIIGAILHDPEILFLDEPTIGLDIDSKKSIRLFLRKLHSQGKTILLTSHDMDDIATVCHRAIIINHGRIIYDGEMETLKTKYSSSRYLKLSFVKKVPDSVEIEKLGNIIELRNNRLTLKVPKEEAMKVATEISNKYTIHDITIEQVALEEIISDVFHQG